MGTFSLSVTNFGRQLTRSWLTKPTSNMGTQFKLNILCISTVMPLERIELSTTGLLDSCPVQDQCSATELKRLEYHEIVKQTISSIRSKATRNQISDPQKVRIFERNVENEWRTKRSSMIRCSNYCRQSKTNRISWRASGDPSSLDFHPSQPISKAINHMSKNKTGFLDNSRKICALKHEKGNGDDKFP